jgi:hypothetical protein
MIFECVAITTATYGGFHQADFGAKFSMQYHPESAVLPAKKPIRQKHSPPKNPVTKTAIAHNKVSFKMKGFFGFFKRVAERRAE